MLLVRNILVNHEPVYGEFADFDQPQLRHGKTTAAIWHGQSKDHRPNLKQLLYILTVTDDGVPVYFITNDDDQHEDNTHQPTWNLLRELTGRSVPTSAGFWSGDDRQRGLES